MPEDKFETEAVPLILAAVAQARKAAIDERQSAEIIIHISQNGGMDGLVRQTKKIIK